jgi:hypothetical protein
MAVLLAVLLAAPVAVPLPAAGTPSVLGTVRGQRAVKVSLDGGKTWLAVGGLALPVVPGAELRTSGGVASLEMGEARINLAPFTTVRFAERRDTTEVSLLSGRLAFRLPVRSRVEIVTPLARLEPTGTKPRIGELFVSGSDLMGLKMREGTLQVRPAAEPQRPILASRAPVFLPKPPETTDSLFSSDALPTPPASSRAAFTPAGESIGYLDARGRLVIHPGFTANLTRPFAPKLVQLAANDIPVAHRQNDAVPLFDVNAGYLGYLSGPAFYAQLQADPPGTTPPRNGEPEKPPATESTGWSSRTKWTIAAVVAGVVVAGGIAAFAIGGGGSSSSSSSSASPPPATP